MKKRYEKLKKFGKFVLVVSELDIGSGEQDSFDFLHTVCYLVFIFKDC